MKLNTYKNKNKRISRYTRKAAGAKTVVDLMKKYLYLCTFKMPIYNLKSPIRRFLGYKGVFISDKVTVTSHIQRRRPKRSAFKMRKGVIWNDWPVYEINDGQNGDILASGAWGKIVIFNNKTVVKIPINPYYCMDFANEHNILREIKPVKNSIINVLSTELSVAVYNSDERVRGKVELIKQKYIYNSDIEIQKSCIFFMQRIYPPKLESLNALVNLEKYEKIQLYHNNVTRPYYLFLGRIKQWSISGYSNKNIDIGTLSLSELNGVIPDIKIPEQIINNICLNYSGSGMVFANYGVENGSFCYNTGKAMCKYVWDVFIQKQIILYDTEFVYGQVMGKTKIFIIDCNLCKKIEQPISNKVKTELVNHFAAAMDIRLPSVNPEHWGGFLPNPLLSPNFAIMCLNEMVNDNDSFEIQVIHANFMLSFFTNLSAYISNLDNKGILTKFEKDIKHVIEIANIPFFVDIMPFKLIPENHEDAIGIEKQIKLLNKQLNDCHAYFSSCYAKAYLLEISLAIGKELYSKLVSSDNISFVSSIISSRVTHWLLNPNFSFDNISTLFLPVTTDETILYIKEQTSNAEKYEDRSYTNNTRVVGKKYKSFHVFSEIE